MIRVYLWSEQGLYYESREVHVLGQMPMRSTPTAPPELVGNEVAQWNGSEWVKLDQAPPLPEPPAPAEEPEAVA